MRQLVFTGPGTTEWIDAADPPLTTAEGAIVEPTVVSTCDMDAVALAGTIRFRPGTPLGHEGIGVVVEVGDAVRSLSPGDQVIMPWQVSCGACDRCRRGQDTFCTTVPPGSCYGWGPHVKRWGGFLADRVEVPYADHMLVPVPAGLDPTWATGIGDNLTDAWRAVGPALRETGGGRVLVVGGGPGGGGSIGLYAVAFAVHLGATEVAYISHDPALGQLAVGLGATAVVDVTDGSGASGASGAGYPDLGHFDVTADTSGRPDGLAHALRSTGPGGVSTCTAGAVHRGRPVPLPVYEMYMHVVTFRTGWVHTRALLAEPLRLVAEGAFDPTSIASIHPFDDAVDAFAEPFTKLILQRG
jgi:threonine dehydrogenase-like Zn-dependent dehydrogenase